MNKAICKKLTLLFAAALTMAGCGRTYYVIPNAFSGHWKSDNSTAVTSIRFYEDKLTITEESGEKYTCPVKIVNVHADFLGKGKKTVITCDENSSHSLWKLKSAGSKPSDKLYTLEITVKQDDSEFYDYADISEYSHTSCSESIDIELGLFHHKK